MTISVNHSTINNSKPMFNHANICTLLIQKISDKHKIQLEKLQAVYLIVSELNKTLTQALRHFSPWLTIDFDKNN